jgi:type I restriction enzyme, S subunit
MSEWRKYRLEELTEVKGGKRLPKGELLVEYETNHPYIRVTDLGNKWIKKDGLQYVTSDIQKNISRYIVNAGDVILSIVGSIGLVGRIPTHLDGANLTENCVKFKTKKELIDDDFLYYLLKSDIVQQEIYKGNVGSTQPKLPLYNIKFIELNIPSVPEQRAIASVLSSLDDKIDLLHRQNETLEQLAETIFRQWFIEEAQDDWEIGKLEDFIEIRYGKDHKHLNEGNIPVYGSGGIMRYADTALWAKPSVLIPRKGTLENVILVTEPFWSVDTMFYTSIKKDNSLYFVYQFVKTLDLAGMNVGSAVPSMTSKALNSVEMRIPPFNVIHDYEVKAKALFAKIFANKKQISTLEKQRDTLLPKLMSGEVRVKH